MSENDIPNVEIESTRDGYRVTVNGKPVTGPLPRGKAEKVANIFENSPKEPSKRGMFPVLLGLSIVAGGIAFLISGNSATGIIFTLICFVVASIVFLFMTSD